MRKTKTILIVDDDELLAGAMQCLLEDNGHVVFSCYNGLDAIALSKKQYFDMIVIDYHMPGMKGDVVCRLLRHHHPDVIIIGCSSEPLDKIFLDAGANHFIKKEQFYQYMSLFNEE